MPVYELEKLEEFEQIINSGRTVMVDFWAPWSGPCRVMSPIFERLAGDDARVGFYKVNVDVALGIRKKIGIRTMPTFVVFKNGATVEDMVGSNVTRLQTMVQNALIT